MLCFRSKTHILTLYFLDSGSYSSGVLDLWGLFHGSEYDWIHQDQINWFLQESGMRFKFRVFTSIMTRMLGSIDPIERPFTPDGAKDLGDIWKRQGVDQITPNTRRLAKPNALVFFHMPVYVLPLPLALVHYSDIIRKHVSLARKVILRLTLTLQRESRST